MGVNWKRIDDAFYVLNNGSWVIVNADDVYCSAFGGTPSKNSVLPDNIESIREVFPEIRFSKLSVSPALSVKFESGKIILDCYFTRLGKNYSIALPKRGGVSYGFAGSTWCYFSGDYDQIVEALAAAEIDSHILSFKQYVSILNSCRAYDGLSLIDEVGSHLEDSLTATKEPQPAELKANLYPYQETGFRWLKYVTDDDCGCILGDEMGLGKTLQVIALLVDRQQKKKAPSLVVAPLSLLENWKREIARFAPGIDVMIHHGSFRTGRYMDLLEHDVIVTSYGATITDLSLFGMIQWDLLVLDEAQNIKNPDALRTASIKQIPHRAAIAVTGTPFENHITDLWSILDFTVPGCLGTLHDFNRTFSDDLYGAEKIEPILSALMIRRKVDDVAKDLPEKVIISQPLVMDDAEAQRYEDSRQKLVASFNSKSATLATLTKLRMYCTHPFLLDDSTFKDPKKASSKYSRFCELVEEIVEQDEKVIVFCSYTEMFDIIRNDITFRFSIPVDCINGQTPAEERQIIVDKFSDRLGPAMLVLNPRAAGVGLNITAANHVIHYNLEWNPALEDQATARSFRRGQDKTVFVYRLYYLSTVEEIVNEKIESKRSMSDTAVVGTTGAEDTKTLIIRALGMSPIKEA